MKRGSLSYGEAKWKIERDVRDEVEKRREGEGWGRGSVEKSLQGKRSDYVDSVYNGFAVNTCSPANLEQVSCLFLNY